DAERGPDHQRRADPFEVDDLRREQRADDRRRHSGDAGRDAAPRRPRMIEPAQRQDEQDRREEVTELNQMLVHLCFSRNILSIRSVIRKPLTMLVIDAATATVPRIVVSVDSRSPAMRIEPTTAIA